MGSACGVSGCCVGGKGRGDGGGVKGERTLGVELEYVNVAVCVSDGNVELFVRREEGGCYHFDGMRRFAEEAELIGFLLCPVFDQLLSCNVTVVRGLGEVSRTV